MHVSNRTDRNASRIESVSRAAVIAVVWFFTRLTCPGAEISPRPPSPLPGDLIDNIRVNEELFEQISLKCRIEYEHLGEPYTTTLPDFRLTLHEDQRTRYVRQDGKFRIDVESDYTSYQIDERQHYDRIRMFDLAKTRALVDGIVNITDGNVPDDLNLRPHMLILSDVHYPVKLSTYLRGQVALAATPGVQWKDGVELEIGSLGEESVGGLTCHKLSLIHSLHGKRIFRTILWLAVDRNYLPARMETYTYRWSTTVPIGDGEMRSFAELEPGTWFPAEAVDTCYEGRAVSEGRQEPMWRRKFCFEDVSLHPAYPDEFFSKLEIPIGAAVHEVVDGKIVRSYREGAPGRTGSGALGISWVLWLNILVVCVVGVAMWLRRRRHQSKQLTAASGSRPEV